MLKKNQKLGELIIDNIPKAPKGRQKVVVELEIDVNGILHCTTTKKADNVR